MASKPCAQAPAPAAQAPEPAAPLTVEAPPAVASNEPSPTNLEVEAPRADAMLGMDPSAEIMEAFDDLESPPGPIPMEPPPAAEGADLLPDEAIRRALGER